MELKLKRSQRMSGLMSKKPVFMLDARIELTRDEAELVRKYGLGDYAVYDSAERQQAASNAMDHAQAAQASGSVGGALFRLGRAYLSAAMAKMSLRVSVNSLIAGQHIECKDLEELSRYTYYHCSKRRLPPRCAERSIQLGNLEGQIISFLERVRLSEQIAAWIARQIEKRRAGGEANSDLKKQSLQNALEEVERSISTLTNLRVRELIDDAEFVSERQKLQRERLRLTSSLAEAGTPKNWFEPASDLVSFSSRAVEWFKWGDAEIKRLIVQTVGSNLSLKDKILSIEARKPFRLMPPEPNFSQWCAFVDDIRTFGDTPEYQMIFDNIRKIRGKMEPAMTTAA